MKYHARDFSLDDAPWLGRPVEVDSNQIETLIENNQCYTGDSQHIQNIQINKVIKLTKKIKSGEFLCSYCNIEDGRKYATFSAYYASLFQER